MGRDFNQTLPAPPDGPNMRALFDYGYQRARRGYDWAKKPPFVRAAHLIRFRAKGLDN